MEEGEKEASSSDALECLHDELFNLLDLICVQRKKGELQAICSLLSLPRRSKMKILNVLTSAEPESRTSSEFQEFESAKGQFEKSVLQRALFLYQPKDNDAFIKIIKNYVKQDVQRTINELFDSVQKEIQSKSQEPILDKTETESAKPQPKPQHLKQHHQHLNKCKKRIICYMIMELIVQLLTMIQTKNMLIISLKI